MRLSLVLLFLLLGCSHGRQPTHFIDQRFQTDLDKKPIPFPSEVDPENIWDRVYNKIFRQVYRLIDIPGWFQDAGESLNLVDPTPAKNINSWGEVPDSSWFTNRIGRGEWSPKKSSTGPRPHAGPDTSGSWTVIQGKADGVSAGFTVLDAKQEMYFVKLDPPGYRELASGAEVVSSLLMHSAGYYVPAYYALSVPPSIFVLGKKAKIKGQYGVKRTMTQDDLKRILSTVTTDKNQNLRLSASVALPGKPLGRFFYEGRRADDPNDRIAHEHRRELRAYHVFAAWVNNTDIRFQNTLDMYQGEKGQGYIRHYMIDFGTTLGSAGDRPKGIRTGYEQYVDYEEMGRRIVRFGAGEPYWKNVKESQWSSVGVFEAEVFDPLRWRTQYNNRAFELMTPQDGFWAAKIIARFSDEDLRAIISQAHYSSKEAEEYIFQTLKVRQEKIMRAWFSQVSPLDDFILDGNHQLRFTDLEVAKGLTDQKRKFQMSWISSEFKNLEAQVAEVNSEGGVIVDLDIPQTHGHEALQLNITSLNQPKLGAELSFYCLKGSCQISRVERNIIK